MNRIVVAVDLWDRSMMAGKLHVKHRWPEASWHWLAECCLGSDPLFGAAFAVEADERSRVGLATPLGRDAAAAMAVVVAAVVGIPGAAGSRHRTGSERAAARKCRRTDTCKGTSREDTGTVGNTAAVVHHLLATREDTVVEQPVPVGCSSCAGAGAAVALGNRNRGAGR